jgi:hypothetical protein
VTEEVDLVCYPWSASTWWLAGWGLVTAGMSWFFPGANPLSQWLHLLVGGSLTGFALWGVWRPRITVTAGRLVERPGSRRERTLSLARVARVIASPTTGHRPSERDLDSQLGLRLEAGDYRWIDLRWLRPDDRQRLRSCVEPDPTPHGPEPTAGRGSCGCAPGGP